jgi:hypothetical protein
MIKKTCLRQHSKALPKAKDDLQRERFMGAIRALDDAEDTLALDRGPVSAALPAPAMSVQDAARRRLAEAVESSALDVEEEQPTAAPAASKAARKRKTADERLAEANAGAKPKEAPAASPAPQETVSQPPVDDARDLTYEREISETPAPESEFGRETADQDEPEVEAFRDGWRARSTGKTRLPPRTITQQDVAQAWIAGYDALQKTIDIGNAPRDADASEAMLSRMIDKQFA